MAKKIIVTERDYALISKFINYNPKNLSYYAYSRLVDELKEASIVAGDKTPQGVIGLNSEVMLYENTLGKEIKVTLVLPSKVNPKNNMVSIFSPLGVALIGYREGDSVEWEVQGSVRKYKILQVNNSGNKK
ncbi:GreA/GreB family elongation factor [Catalinimonas sp. 4WD22]|uniref:GreA/GreB family elongation factor n=1 Tax=Catalinimonas locisalis TaxID=3133978 RepID=UPI003100E4A3